MRKKQIFIYIGLFIIAILAMLGIGYGVLRAIRAGNLAGIDWYDVNGKEFVISTEEELYEFELLSNYYDFEGQTIKLGADIVVNEGNAKDWKDNAPAKTWQPITEFAGSFDGQGHSISGLYGKSASISMGLFSETKEGCVIKNFKLLNSFFSNSSNKGLGSILGEGAGTVQQVYSDAYIYGRGEANGGIAGLITDELVLEECWFDGTVIGEKRSNGGMIGWIDRKGDVTIDNCLNSGYLEFTGTGGTKTGGFVGGISEFAYRSDVSLVKITNSLTTGEIKTELGAAYTGAAVGAVRGSGALTFENTYAMISTENEYSEITLGFSDGKVAGNAIPRFYETLVGVGGYQWTNLDFDKYWACVEGETPTLKCFAKQSLSVDGVEKKVDTSWYQKNKTEFVIEDVADFWGFAMLTADTTFDGITIKLGADITINESDRSTWKETKPEYNWFPCYSFSGIFDGQGHTISGMYCYTNGRYIGMFKQVNGNASVENFKLLNSYFRGTYCVGSVAGHGGGMISNIYTDSIVENTKEHTGGILGAMNQNGTMSNCWFDGEVFGGTAYTGGITSAAMRDMCGIMHCLNTGIIHTGTTGATGGIVGIVNNSVMMTDCLNAGIIDDKLSTLKIGSVIGHLTNESKANIVSTYTVKESYKTSIGQGWTASGAVFTNTKAQLTGTSAYQRTILNFDRYWAINKNGTPILKTFAEEIPELPNVKRPYEADIDWFDDDETTFVIKTAEQLYGLSQLVGNYDFEGKTIKLGKDITLNTGNAAAWETSIPLNQWASINSFNGTFDGQGHTISGVYMSDGMWRVGLFGNVKEGAVIKNLKVKNSYIEGGYHMGGVAGYLTKANVDGVYSEAIVKARDGHAGGVVGTISDGTVNNSWFAGQMIGDGMYIGGIASFTVSDTSVLSNCLNTGSVTGKGEVGGILGRAASKHTTIKYSLNAGNVTSEGKFGSVLGYIVADTYCDIAEGVYATKESALKTTGNGGTAGVVIVNTVAELTGDGGYQRTILDFDKYWAVQADSTPVLKKFGGTAPTNLNVARVIFPDTSWYSAKSKTYVLNDYADLYGFAVLAGDTNFAGKTIKLGADIVGNTGNAKDWIENTPLNQWVTIGNFAGTFDGQGHTISGLSQNNDSAWNAGLFGKTADGALIQNVNIKNCCLEGEYHIGSIAGSIKGTTIENCYSEAIIEATSGHTGGIAGSMNGSTIRNCWFNGSVVGVKHYAGGMTSFMSGDKNKIEHCLNTGSVAAWTTAGGLVGLISGPAELTDSLSTGKIGGSVTLGSIIGSISKETKVTMNAVYGARDAAKYAVASGTYTGDAMAYWKNTMEGYSGYAVTGLDFDKYWVAKSDETPALRYFAGTDHALKLRGVDRIDTSWYNSDKKTLTINNRAELLGFAYLVNSGNDFAGKTVRLGKDIVFNEGDADSYTENAPMYSWTPIGSTINHANETLRFAGTFTGKDTKGVRHTISGLYTNTPEAWFVGLFGATKDAKIKDVEVVNSYFAGQYYVASAVGHAIGSTVSTIYSDANIYATAGNSGGIAGGISNVTITNVWFNGTLEANSVDGGIAGVAFTGTENELSNCLNTATIKAGGNTGGLLGLVQGTVRMVECLSASETAIESNAGSVGSVIGSIAKDSGKAKISRVYALASTHKVAIGGNPSLATTSPKIYTDLSGYNGYTLTKLDFANYWVAKVNTTPELKSFADGSGMLAIDTTFRSSTEWYTEAVADVAGNAPGTEENPYILMDKADLYGFAELVNEGTTFKGQYVNLGDDIIVNRGTPDEWDEKPDYEWMPIGTYVGHGDFTASFLGTFDGADPDSGELYSISGLYTKKTGTANNMNNWCAGLFGKTGAGAVIKNVKVLDSYFESVYYSGIIGHSTGTTIQNIYTNATVHASRGNNGGIAGTMSDGTISNCWFDGTVTSGSDGITGGLIGLINTGTLEIKDCLNTGIVSSKGNIVGGFVGMIQQTTSKVNVTLTDSLNIGNVSSTDIVKTGTLIGVMEGNLYVDKNSVHTTQSGLTYSIAWLPGALYDMNENEIPRVGTTRNSYVPFQSIGCFLRNNAKINTGLSFYDAGANPNGVWTVDKAIPVLRDFAEYLDESKLSVDIAWVDNPTKETINGAEVNTYKIGSKKELLGLAEYVNGGNNFEGEVIYLTADIELNQGDASKWANGEGVDGLLEWTPIGISGKAFKGTFDGQGHNITGMYAVKPALSTNSSVGLFGYVDTAVIKNTRLINGYVQMDQRVGSFAASSTATKFESLYSDVIVKGTGNNIGGLVGELTFGGGLTNCWFKGTVNGGQFVGGLVGRTCAGDIKITGCLNSGTVSSTGLNAGGFIGFSQEYQGTAVTLSNSLNVGSISSPNIERTGALVGNIEGKIYVDKDSVHTVQSGLTYAFAWFPGSLYDMNKTEVPRVGTTRNSYVPFTDLDYLKGVNGYLNTGLGFDRPETSETQEGVWITTDSHPILGEFIDLFDESEYKVNTDMTGKFRADTLWANQPVTKTIDEVEVKTYSIDTTDELLGLAKLVNNGKNFAGEVIYLTADVTMNTGDAKEWAKGNNTSGLLEWAPIGISGKAFKGTFDGQGHNIIGMYAVKPALSTNSSAGLFGYVDTAVIKNIRLINGYAQMDQRVGSFAASSIATKFENLYSNVIVKGTSSNVGGLVGEVTYGGGFTNCWFAGTVSGGGFVGGLAGRTCAGDIKITGCLNSGNVSSTGVDCGGFVGFSQLYQGTAVTLTNSLNVGSVSSPDIVKTGALIGRVEGSLYVDQNSVHTVQSGLNYAFAWFAATLYDIDKNVIANTGNENRNKYVPFTSLEDLKGEKATQNTGLVFDNPNTTDVVEGPWITTDSYPILSQFSDMFVATE